VMGKFLHLIRLSTNYLLRHSLRANPPLSTFLRDYCDAVYSAKDEQYANDMGREYDRDAKYENVSDAIADAVGASDLSDLERTMLDALNEIPVGYFDDEK
jgi:hypothetical protein